MALSRRLVLASTAMATEMPTLDIESFITDGYVTVPGAVDEDVAGRIREAAANLVPVSGTSPWQLGRSSVYDMPVLIQAITKSVRQAFDALAGAGKWHVTANWGFPTRFPGPADALWHIDGDWFTHHVNSGEQILTPIFLWDDVGPDDSPTLLCRGSHRRVAQVLAEHEPAGIPGDEVAALVHETIEATGIVGATGSAGDVIVCHPFLAHSINPDGPRRARFISNVRGARLHAAHRARSTIDTHAGRDRDRPSARSLNRTPRAFTAARQFDGRDDGAQESSLNDDSRSASASRLRELADLPVRGRSTHARQRATPV